MGKSWELSSLLYYYCPQGTDWFTDNPSTVPTILFQRGLYVFQRPFFADPRLSSGKEWNNCQSPSHSSKALLRCSKYVKKNWKCMWNGEEGGIGRMKSGLGNSPLVKQAQVEGKRLRLHWRESLELLEFDSKVILLYASFSIPLHSPLILARPESNFRPKLTKAYSKKSKVEDRL